MKKIAFVLSHMNVGGVEKALLSLVSEISTKDYEITIFLGEKKGEFLNFIPNNIIIKEFPFCEYAKNYPTLGFKGVLNKLIKKFRLLRALHLILGIIGCNIFQNDIILKKFLFGNNKIQESYDIVVNYAGPVHSNSILAESILISKMKLIWIHTEFEKSGKRPKKYLKRYSRYNRIIGVSEKCVNEFKVIIPELASRTRLIYNIISKRLINEMKSKGSGFEDKYKGLRILTVGRLSNEKGYDIAINVLEMLIKKGYDVKWYVVGGGKEYYKLKKICEEKNLEKSFIFLGSKPNPYPYFNQCDIYVQPSRYEGYSTTLSEAKVFNKPIVTTRVSGAEEQIINGQTGIIVDIDEIEIMKAVEKLINSKSLRQRLIHNLSLGNYDTTQEVYKFYREIDDYFQKLNEE